MKHSYLLCIVLAVLATSCGQEKKPPPMEEEMEKTTEEGITKGETNKYWSEKFADMQINRYFVDSWDELNLDQKKLLFYLSEAALSGRDILWDQNYRHNLLVRKTIEDILNNYSGAKEGEEWDNFVVYCKRVFVSNGIHHDYSSSKLPVSFSKEYFANLLAGTYENEKSEDLMTLLESVIFDPEFDAKKVNKAEGVDMVAESANNFYQGLTQAEVEAYYKEKIDTSNRHPVEYGHNSQLVKENNEIFEKVWKVGGMYTQAIEQVVYWLRKAVTVAENETQKESLELLVHFYETGDLKDWDAYNKKWVTDTSSVVDVINGFIEVYGDPLGYRATFESVVSIKDFEASDRMKVVANSAQWFEDNSPIMEEHKKKEVVGVSYKVIEVVMEGGDCTPTTPIGINLPNSNWIRSEHGSKSVSLGNITLAYEKASSGGLLTEFANDEEEVNRSQEHGELAGKLHTALHEVIGHASGKLNKGVGTPKETLKNYSSTLEEGRADLVALYYLMDEELIAMGLMPSLEVGKAEYDSYIRNGMMVQLRRLEPGEVIEEDHMRNRQMVAAWVYEKGLPDNVIEKVVRDGKTYFKINDYVKLKELFGDLMREVQRIKSEGDYEAGKALVEGYGVQVDQALHKEVLERAEALEIPAYGGFINPEVVAETDASGEITNVTIQYPDDFLTQMLKYGREYSFLPVKN